jgi:hypothetical protein
MPVSRLDILTTIRTAWDNPVRLYGAVIKRFAAVHAIAGFPVPVMGQ